MLCLIFLQETMKSGFIPRRYHGRDYAAPPSGLRTLKDICSGTKIYFRESLTAKGQNDFIVRPVLSDMFKNFQHECLIKICTSRD